MTDRYARPEPLRANHQLSGFDCGDIALNEWLLERAVDNEGRGASRSYVVVREERVVGYYCLAAAAVPRADATGKARRNMPEPVPAMLLGRLAVDRAEQTSGLGRHLVRDAILRSISAAEIVGARILIAHAASARARDFYLGLGFAESPTDPMHVMIVMADAKLSIAAP